MSADVSYLAALKAAAAGDYDTARAVLKMADRPDELASMLAPKNGGAGTQPATFCGEPARVR